MRITVFTSNQRRHVHLIDSMTRIADEVYAVQECTTAFPGQIADFYDRSEVMQTYFGHVIAAEQAIFPELHFSASNVRVLPLRMGDVNHIDLELLAPALAADYIVVNGASYIKGALAEALIERRALNIHLGTSPYFRGSACNFWAVYDGYPEYVGATIHYLTKGLDSGPMLFHALPPVAAVDAFTLGMQAVKVAYDATAAAIQRGDIHQLDPVPQDKGQEIRYSRYRDWHDDVARDYLNNKQPTPDAIHAALQRRELARFVRPYVPERG